jgi:hypothetical protein
MVSAGKAPVVESLGGDMKNPFFDVWCATCKRSEGWEYTRRKAEVVVAIHEAKGHEGVRIIQAP